jgi:hypothetical protein
MKNLDIKSIAISSALVAKNIMFALVLVGLSSISYSSTLVYTENGYTFSLDPSGVPYFAYGTGTASTGSVSAPSGSNYASIAYCPDCGNLGVLSVTGSSTFTLDSFKLGGFTPPPTFTVSVKGYDSSNNLIYDSGAISVTGTTTSLQLVTTGMTSAVSRVTITPTNGDGDCVCTSSYTLTSGGTTVVVIDGGVVGSSYVVGTVSTVNLAPNAYALRSVYNIQSAALNAGLSYDCNVFDKEGLCLSTGGRYSITNSPEATTTSGLLIGSYKYDKNVRVGAWVDQNLSTQNADGIKLSNNAPLFGVFGVWAERNDGLGYEVKVSAGYGDKDVTVTRTSTNEGSSKINSRGLQTVSSYGIALDSDWIAAPYVGVKYVSLKRGAYAEAGSDGLAYDNLRQESTSVIAGVKFTGKIDPKTFTVLSAGVEQDLNNNVGQYSAGSSNTTAFNSNVQKTRPVVSAGVYYDIDKTQRVGLNATHRQEAFESTTSTSALATYTVGF